MRQTRSALPFVLVTLLAAPVAAAAPARPSGDGTGWRLDRLDLDLAFEGAGNRVELSGTAYLRATEPSLGPTLALNNRKAVFDFSRLETRGEPDVQIETGVRSESVEHVRLGSLRRPTPFGPGDPLVVDFALEWQGSAPQAVFGKDYAFASWVDAWYPVPIVAGDDPIASEQTKAPGTTTFRLPAGWTAVSNGARTHRAETEAGVSETWSTEAAVARSFAAAGFETGSERFGDREIGVYLLSPKPVSARNQAATLARAMAAMEDRFGPYPYESYAIVEVPQSLVTWYAASEQGFILAKSSAFEVAGGNVPLFAHEAAHGWWGNLVGSGDDCSYLCSESLAQYGAVVAIEALEGAAAMRDFLEYSRDGYSPWQCAVGYFGIVRGGDDAPLAELPRGLAGHSLSDSKGNWFYHMLRARVGDERFFATLRQLIDSHRDRDLSLDAVRTAFSKAAPEDEGLDRFLAQWLDRTGAPVLELRWWTTDRGNGVELVLVQAQAGEPYELAPEVELRLRGGETQRHRLELRERETRVELETPSRVVDVVLDPDTEILMWHPRYGPVPDALVPSG